MNSTNTLSSHMDQLLNHVVFLNLEMMLEDYESKSSTEKLVFKNNAAAGYFAFQLEIYPLLKDCSIFVENSTVKIYKRRL